MFFTTIYYRRFIKFIKITKFSIISTILELFHAFGQIEVYKP